MHGILMEQAVLEIAVNSVVNVMMSEKESMLVITECIWILTNLACEGDVAEFLVHQAGMLRVIEYLLISRFLTDVNGVCQPEILDLANLQLAATILKAS